MNSLISLAGNQRDGGSCLKKLPSRGKKPAVTRGSLSWRCLRLERTRQWRLIKPNPRPSTHSLHGMFPFPALTDGNHKHVLPLNLTRVFSLSVWTPRAHASLRIIPGLYCVPHLIISVGVVGIFMCPKEFSQSRCRPDAKGCKCLHRDGAV